MYYTRTLAQSETPTALSMIWTWLLVSSNDDDDNRYGRCFKVSNIAIMFCYATQGICPFYHLLTSTVKRKKKYWTYTILIKYQYTYKIMQNTSSDISLKCLLNFFVSSFISEFIQFSLKIFNAITLLSRFWIRSVYVLQLLFFFLDTIYHLIVNNTPFIIFTQPLRSGRIWHKVNHNIPFILANSAAFI